MTLRIPPLMDLDSDADGNIDSTDRTQYAQFTVAVSADGGTTVRIHRAKLGSALMVDHDDCMKSRNICCCSAVC